MSAVMNNQLKEAISKFLLDQYEKKATPELKTLEKLDSEKDAAKVADINASIQKLKEKYQLETWMKDAALRMAKQLRFGTHISKGVHPDSKGDNISFSSMSELPEGLVASQTLLKLDMDANGNAAALPLAAFFDTPIDEFGSIRIRDLIQRQDPSLQGAFSADEQLSAQYAQHFKAALDNALENPRTDELNKQLLWPLVSAVSEDRYITLVPLHPAALTHQVYQKLNEIRFGEANKQAKENNKKQVNEKAPYVSLHDLSVIQLGGTKPQNISQLTSKQRGRTYLIPSLPPTFESRQNYRLSLSQTTIFDSKLAQACWMGLSQLYEVILEEKSTVDVRDVRAIAVDILLADIFSLAEQIQKASSPGWSKDYSLSISEKCWLDPGRAALDGQEDFAKQRSANDWKKQIAEVFALWLNDRLKARFKNIASQFGDAEFYEWKKEFEDAIGASVRAGQEVFA
ncbi:MAG: type I-F CRISPR-associated protein Csy1 [Pseudomonadales bacterium]|nr:type I-F CRISPR-associated protein Csy1 [Pseudomonadales bacterium]